MLANGQIIAKEYWKSTKKTEKSSKTTVPISFVQSSTGRNCLDYHRVIITENIFREIKRPNAPSLLL